MRHFCVETGGYISLPFGYFYLSYRSEKLGQARTTSRLTTLKFSRSNSNPTPVFWSHFDLKIWNSKWYETLEIENFHWKVNTKILKKVYFFREFFLNFFKILVLTFKWKCSILKNFRKKSWEVFDEKFFDKKKLIFFDENFFIIKVMTSTI